MTYPTSSNLYTQGYGSKPENVEIPMCSSRSPQTYDFQYPLGKRWINLTFGEEYCLTSFSSSRSGLSAIWTQLGGQGGMFPDSVGITAPLNAGGVTVIDLSVVASSIIIYSPANLDVINADDWSCPTPSTGIFEIFSLNTADTTNFFYAVFNLNI